MSLRVGDPERERAVLQLRRHLLDGRLEMEEFAERVGAAYDAQTQADLDKAMVGLPALPIEIERSANRRHDEADIPELDWRPTSERFRDETTGRIVRVWVDPDDGSRHPIAE